ncbi:hypothetical protein [Parasphingorhabdus cellanae]|uniref:Uncharacterized protein n=1 Tax=Parasphingorhabdus cellanae TaxID=2806553 RepID=A0ABX7T459_9SPHN|nr:hypothetical protein [Parasphingorhabdus cellanae]QTD56376.1 hypothetical protein J4G78_01880 [Parasphingorhabdus cellanae]
MSSDVALVSDPDASSEPCSEQATGRAAIKMAGIKIFLIGTSSFDFYKVGKDLIIENPSPAKCLNGRSYFIDYSGAQAAQAAGSAPHDAALALQSAAQVAAAQAPQSAAQFVAAQAPQAAAQAAAAQALQADWTTGAAAVQVANAADGVARDRPPMTASIAESLRCLLTGLFMVFSFDIDVKLESCVTNRGSN